MFKEITETRHGLRLTCQRCKHEWNYFGKQTDYVSCPKCRTLITLHPKRIRKQK